MPGRPLPFCSLDDVIVAPAEGPARPKHRPVAETDVFLALSRTLAEDPQQATQRLVELGMRLVGADSAGLSVEEQDAQGPFLRWVATTGELARYVHGTMPRDFSPCGTAMNMRRTLVMREPVRYYAYISQLHVPVHAVLLVPFTRGGRTVGTLWVVGHAPDRTFTGEEVRVVQNLATFASSVLDAVERGRPAH